MLRNTFLSLFALAWSCFSMMLSSVALAQPDSLRRGHASRPNVLWIFVDDMSDWLGCYGDRLAETPAIDALAATGVRFENAFVPSPVCSTTRSAMITGQMQTSLGLHHHRTMIKHPLPESVVTVPEVFRAAGYVTFNEAKEDYNFLRPRAKLYSAGFDRPKIKGHLRGGDLSWLKQFQGKPFFGQIQLAGGKHGGETGRDFPAASRVSEQSVSVPPQYPDHPVMRNAIARHYEQISVTDEQVGAIVSALREYEMWDNTIVIFFTDHGAPLPRAKQFLYDEGLKVPLIISGGHPWLDQGAESSLRGTVRSDLVHGIDVSATSIALAGLDVPSNYEGRPLFAPRRKPRTHIVAARDRCGIAVDRIRSVRTQQFLYLRNYKPDRALYQPQYRDRYATFAIMRELNEQGKLTALQSSYLDASARPAEELYRVEDDPHQTVNLANRPEFEEALKRHRLLLQKWEAETGDRGSEPEDPEALKLVFKGAKGKCSAPEFDFLRRESK